LPDVARALYMIGCNAKNLSDYYIGNGQFKTLQEHFDCFKAKKVDNNRSDTGLSLSNKLSVKQIKKDLGFEAKLDLVSIYKGAK